jgi:hypothetical protein
VHKKAFHWVRDPEADLEAGPLEVISVKLSRAGKALVCVWAGVFPPPNHIFSMIDFL